MLSRYFTLYKLTPAQIALVDRLAAHDGGGVLDVLEYRELVAFQELQKLGMAYLKVGKRHWYHMVGNCPEYVRDREGIIASFCSGETVDTFRSVLKHYLELTGCMR